MSKSRKCATKGCRRPARADGRGRLCVRCNHAKWRITNPLRYSYGNLKCRAKQRGHEFSLTFEHYKKFAEESGYAKLKGNHGMSLTIERIDDAKGYEVGNIKALTRSANSRRQYVPYWRKLEMELLDKERQEREKQCEDPFWC